MYTVYILECADGTLYTGITTNLARRLQEHQRGVASRYTRARGFKALRYHESSLDRSTATIRECHLKQLTRAAKWELIKTHT